MEEKDLNILISDYLDALVLLKDCSSLFHQYEKNHLDKLAVLPLHDVEVINKTKERAEVNAGMVLRIKEFFNQESNETSLIEINETSGKDSNTKTSFIVKDKIDKSILDEVIKMFGRYFANTKFKEYEKALSEIATLAEIPGACDMSGEQWSEVWQEMALKRGNIAREALGLPSLLTIPKLNSDVGTYGSNGKSKSVLIGY